MALHITSVFYYVPQDNETYNDLNAFPIYMKQDEIRLRDVRECFPLPGNYHFRFQYVFNKKDVVWLDLNNERCKLPTVNDKIIMKVMRKSWTGQGTPATAAPEAATMKPKDAAQGTPISRYSMPAPSAFAQGAGQAQRQGSLNASTVSPEKQPSFDDIFGKPAEV